MGKAGAQIEITASSSRLAAGLSQAYSKFMGFGGSVARGISQAFKKINAKIEPGATAKNAIAHAGGDLIGRGISMITDAAGDVRDFQSELQRLGQTTHRTPAQLAQIEAAMHATSVATGINSNEIVKAAGRYFDLTSDANGMTQAIQVFAKTAQASGADMESLVQTAAAMGDSMGMASSEFESAFSGLIAQGEAGKVTLAELAREAPSLMAMYSQFGKGTGRQGLMEMNAAFQVGAKAFGSASQAATGLEAMMGMLKARQKQLAAAGVQVYKVNKDGTVTLRALHDIVKDIADKKIDPRKYNKIFGENKEGKNFLEMLQKFPSLYDDIVKAGEKSGVVQENALARAESKAGRLDLAFNRMKESVAAAFTPERIEAFVGAVEHLADSLGPVMKSVGWFADKLGSLYGVGKSVGDFLDGSNNPWQREGMAGRMELGTNSEIDMATGRYRSPVERANARRQAQRDVANFEGYESSVKKIMGGEVNEKSTPESIRRAYLASVSDPSKEAGSQRAGLRYLEAVGVTKTQAGEQYTKSVVDELQKVVALLAEQNAKPAPTTTVGDNAVAKAQASSTDARRGTH